MEALLLIFLVSITLKRLLFEKLGIQNKLMMSKSKLLYKLGKCDFCCTFWVAVMVTALWWFLPTKLIWYYPFGVMGIWLVVKGNKDE